MPIQTRLPVPRRSPSNGHAFVKLGADVYAFVLGFTAVFAVHFVGDLFVSELLLLLIFPLLVILKGRRALRPELKMVYILMGCWFIGLNIADAYNHTPLFDRLRGSALILFFAINLLGMTILLGRNDKRKILFLVGLMVGTLAVVKLQPNAAVADYPWKFGYAFGTMQLVMLLSSYFYARRRYVVGGLLVLGIAGVNLLLNFRSPVLGLLLTLVLVFPVIPDRLGSTRILPQAQFARLLVLGVLAFGAAETAGALVNFVTQAGLIDADSQAKNEAQAKSGNLLLGGRPEFAVGLQAALDSPIIGHGSWAKDFKYLEMLNDAMIETGALDYAPDFEQDANGQIPGHSHIITAWVWAGFLGAVFWLYMLWYVMKGMIRVAMLRPPLAPLYMWFLISMWWDIFFSPFASYRRITEAMLILIVADLLEQKAPVLKESWRRMNATIRTRPPGRGQISTSPARSR